MRKCYQETQDSKKSTKAPQSCFQHIYKHVETSVLTLSLLKGLNLASGAEVRESVHLRSAQQIVVEVSFS